MNRKWMNQVLGSVTLINPIRGGHFAPTLFTSLTGDGISIPMKTSRTVLNGVIIFSQGLKSQSIGPEILQVA